MAWGAVLMGDLGVGRAGGDCCDGDELAGGEAAGFAS